mgnify:CR=1 FL=1
MVTSGSDKLKVQVEGNTAVVTIDNPPANTWDDESLGALEALVAQCNADREIYALVITGAGDKFFSAGADLSGARLEEACLGEGVGNAAGVLGRGDPPRPGEVDGKDYHFLSEDPFKRSVADSGMLEHAHVFGHFYGSLY